MIVPHVKLTIIQRRLLLRKKRKRRLINLNTSSTPSRHGMKYNVRKIQYRDIDGVLQTTIPTGTYWYNAYVRSPDLSNEKFHKKFRLRFRLPHSTFVDLHNSLKHHKSFYRWDTRRIIRNKCKQTLISLLILGSLRYLGRRWIFDDIEYLVLELF